MLIKVLLYSIFSFLVFQTVVFSEGVMFERPIRDISIIASNESYYPNHISMFVGETARLYMTTVTQKESCFYLEKTKFATPLKLGEIQSFNVAFDAPGIYFYYCPSNHIRGKIQVIRRPEDVKENEENSKRESRIRKEMAKWKPGDDEYFKENR